MVTSNMDSRNKLISKCKQMGFEVWLPNGENIDNGNSCFPPPFKHFGDATHGVRGRPASAIPSHIGRKPSRVGLLRRIGIVPGFSSRPAFLGQLKF